MKYRFISDNSDYFSVVEMAAIFKIRRSSYYKWLKSSKQRAEKQTKEVKLVKAIKAIQEKSRYSYGTPRITKKLKEQKFDTNHKKVARLLRENGLNHRMKKKFKITTDSKYKFQTAPNILNRDFEASIPNQKWVSDITYIWTA